METIFITGASGWIGLELVEQLLGDGYIIKALSRKNDKKLDEMKKLYNERLHIIIGDMSDIEKWESELIGVNCVIHLAAKVHYKPTNISEIEEFYFINRDCTNKLFDKCLYYELERVIFISTVAVYGESNDLVRSNTNKNPNTHYAKSKSQAEDYSLELYDKYKFPITIIQPVTVYGGNDRGNFRKIYKLFKRGINVKFGDGSNRKTIIYYKDLAKMIKMISKDFNAIGKVIICGTETIEYNLIEKKFKKIDGFKLNVHINNYFSNKIISLLKNTKVSILEVIYQNIESLKSNNIYDIKDSLVYLEPENIQKFESWDCNKEYK